MLKQKLCCEDPNYSQNKPAVTNQKEMIVPQWEKVGLANPPCPHKLLTSTGKVRFTRCKYTYKFNCLCLLLIQIKKA